MLLSISSMSIAFSTHQGGWIPLTAAMTFMPYSAK